MWGLDDLVPIATEPSTDILQVDPKDIRSVRGTQADGKRDKKKESTKKEGGKSISDQIAYGFKLAISRDSFRELGKISKAFSFRFIESGVFSLVTLSKLMLDELLGNVYWT